MDYSQLGLHEVLTGPHEGYFRLSFQSGVLPSVVFGIMKRTFLECVVIIILLSSA